jgi:biopolymer transport protein TolQ
MSLSSHLFLSLSGLQYGLEHSTTSGHVICAILFVLSIVSWSVMLVKLRLISRARAANAQFIDYFKRSPHPLAVFQRQEHYDESPAFHIYHAACRELAFHLTGREEADASFATRLQGAGRISPSQMTAVQGAMERAVGEAALKLEARMGVVAMALSGAPFLGLLGTVWGVMDSFSALATSKEAVGLQAMAPGVSAALLTTVVGLLVAIPSMFGYNLLVNRIRALIVRLDNFASELNGVLDRHFVDHRNAQAESAAPANFGEPDMPVMSSAPAARTASTPAVSAPALAAMSRPPEMVEATSEL